MRAFLSTCLALLAFAVAAARLAAWADEPAEPAITINAVNVAETVHGETTIAADPTARMKFPHAKAVLVDTISSINRFVNTKMRGVTDDEQYGEDLWVMMPASMAGDCEDYVLTKFALLEKLGYPPLAMRLVGVLVTEDGQQYGHAILEILLPDGSHAFLDNLHNDLMTRPELEAEQYQFVPWGD